MSQPETIEPTTAILRVAAALEEHHQVITVQRLANEAKLTYMETYDLINRLFLDGLLAQDLQVTDAGRKKLA